MGFQQTLGIVYILWLRQLKRYWRSKARMIGSLGQPLLFLLALGFGFQNIFAKAGGGDYIQFLVPGIIAMSILFTAMFAGIELIWDRQFGFLKETLVAPVSRTSIMMGRTLGGATIAFFQGVVVLLISSTLGFRIVGVLSVEGIVLLTSALLFMFLIGLLFTTLGTVIASRMQDMQAFPLIMNFLMMPLFFLSGALFPLTGLPKALKIITLLDPLTYGVDGLRGTLGGASHFGLAVDFGVTFGVLLLALVAGTWLFSKIEA